ncbi:hypothetical protein PINS_up006032 [Pythium insidiosum]|nr:hypothetical protein PINS_up006032 [Pythium insidiosum]
MALRRMVSENSMASPSSDEDTEDNQATTNQDDEGIECGSAEGANAGKICACEPATSSLFDAMSLQSLQGHHTQHRRSSVDSHASPSTQLHATVLAEHYDLNRYHTKTSETADPSPPTSATSSEIRRARRRSSVRALSTSLSDEDRRAKQRMIVKRCYYKKINTLSELRDQVQSLEHEFRDLLEDQERQKAALLQQASSSPEAIEHIQHRDRYIAVVKEKETLQRENLQLRRLADEYYMKNQGKMRTLLDANRKDMVLFTPAVSD